jgi:bifunctional ADP-heptose synthase (sugar kinase/adenylyltransferase)
MLTTDFIEHVLAAVPGKAVGLLGDLFLDRYFDIDPALDEPSVETGKTAYQVTRVRSYPGALGTVVNNLAALGVGHIYPVAIIGDDGEGYELRQALAKLPAVDPGGLVVAADRRTPTYAKPMYGGEELNRLDTKNRTPTPAGLEDRVLALFEAAWAKVDAWIVLDQVSEADCGVVTARVRDRIARVANGDPGRFVLADSRERIGLFRNVCAKPNEAECLAAVWIVPPKKFTRDDRAFAPLDLARQIKGPVFLTRGAAGITFAPRPSSDGYAESREIPAYPVAGPIDVCGAGDSTSAGITCATVCGATPEQAAAFGNLVASITIRQVGTTGTATPDMVRARWREVSVL